MSENEETLSERAGREAREYSRSLLGSIFGNGFWGIVGAGLAVAIFGVFLKNSEWLQEQVADIFGLEGQLLVDNMFSMLNMEPVYGAERIEAAFMELSTEDAINLIKNQLERSEVIVGDHMLEALLDGPNRAITMQLLKDQEFSFSSPSLTSEMVSQALLNAITGETPITGVTEAQRQAYSNAVLTALTTDIQEIKAGGQTQNVGLLTKARDMFDQYIMRQDVDRTGLSIAENPAFMNVIITAMPDKALDYLAAMSESETVQTFLANETNRAATIELLRATSAEHLSTLTQSLFTQTNNTQTGDDAMSLPENQEFSLANLLNPDLLLIYKDDPETLRNYLTSIDLGTIPEEQRAHLSMARNLLLSESDVAAKTNLDVILGLANSPEAMAALTTILNQVSQGQLNGLADVQISEEVAQQVSSAVQDLDFGRTSILADLQSNEDTQMIGGALGIVAQAGINEQNIPMLNGMMQAAGVDLTLDPEVASSVRESEQEDGLDMVVNVAVGSAINATDRTR